MYVQDIYTRCTAKGHYAGRSAGMRIVLCELGDAILVYDITYTKL